MKYSALPTFIGALIIFFAQFFIETEKYATTSTIYFIAVIALVSLSMTISTAKNKP